MRVYVESHGCTQNQGEGAAIARELAERGHGLAAAPEGADVAVLVTCGVIGPTESRMLRRYRELAATLPKVIVTGCLVPLRSALFEPGSRAGTTLVPIREQGSIPALLDSWAGGASGPAPPPSEPTHLTEEVVLAQGCTSHCSYCFSRLARGRLSSVPLPELVRRVRRAVHRGAVEVRLSSLDTSAWAAERPDGERLPELLDALGHLRGRFRLRLGMMSPQTLAPFAARYWPALGRAPAFRFLHLPVQSGSDRILERMRRGYSAAEFGQLVRDGRAALPGLTVSTDVIAGYPGETEDDHRATLELLGSVAPEIVNVTRFSARPMTPAAREPQLPGSTAKRRSRELTELRRRLARERLEAWVGFTGPALVTEPARGGDRLARLENYLPVVVGPSARLGSEVRVRVDGAGPGYLLGHPLDAPGATAG